MEVDWEFLDWPIRLMNNNAKAQFRKPEAPSLGNNAAFPPRKGVWLADLTLPFC